MKILTLPEFTRDTQAPSALLEQYHNAAEAVETAYNAVSAIPLDHQLYTIHFDDALAERNTMLTSLRDIKGQLTDIANHCRQHCRKV